MKILKLVQMGSPEGSKNGGDGVWTSGLSPSKSLMSGPRAALSKIFCGLTIGERWTSILDVFLHKTIHLHQTPRQHANTLRVGGGSASA